MTTDLWSDSNLSPFMAVTAHWIETKEVSTLDGPQLELKLRSDLIGFHRVPGHHDGEHLAQSFLYIIDRLSLAKKVCDQDLLIVLVVLPPEFKLGWITLDNASNNDTLMQTLEYNLRYCGIFFDCIKNRIRYVFLVQFLVLADPGVDVSHILLILLVRLLSMHSLT